MRVHNAPEVKPSLVKIQQSDTLGCTADDRVDASHSI